MLRRFLIPATLLVAAVIHLLPVPGVLGAEQLERLYGLPMLEPNLVLLMRHRAVLFGLLGTFLLIAAFRPALRTLAFVAGLVSLVSFLLLVPDGAARTPQIARVVAVDWVAFGALVLGLALHAFERQRAVRAAAP